MLALLTEALRPVGLTRLDGTLGEGHGLGLGALVLVMGGEGDAELGGLVAGAVADAVVLDVDLGLAPLGGVGVEDAGLGGSQVEVVVDAAQHQGEVVVQAGVVGEAGDDGVVGRVEDDDGRGVAAFAAAGVDSDDELAGAVLDAAVDVDAIGSPVVDLGLELELRQRFWRREGDPQALSGLEAVGRL